MIQYAQLAEQGIAFTELGAELEVNAEAELEAEAEADEVAETETETEAESEAEAETESENTPAPVAVVVAPAPVAVAPVIKPAFDPTAIRTDAVKALNPVVAPPGQAAPSMTVILPDLKPQVGWTFRERGAPESVNMTDLYTVAYDRIKCKMWQPVNISQNYPIKEYTYVVVGGTDGGKGYFEPIGTALRSYGVPKESVLVAPINYAIPTVKNADAFFKQLNNTYFNVLKEQKFIIFAHGQGMVQVHAVLSLYPTAASMIHGVIGINPVWGGSVIASNFKGLPADVEKVAKSLGLTELAAADIGYPSRQSLIRSFPIDYNAARVLVIATHKEKADKKYEVTTKYIREYTKEINDGFVALTDQIVPGGRAIMLGNLDHDDLVFPSAKDAPVDATLAAQAYIYTFFKATP